MVNQDIFILSPADESDITLIGRTKKMTLRKCVFKLVLNVAHRSGWGPYSTPQYLSKLLTTGTEFDIYGSISLARTLREIAETEKDSTESLLLEPSVVDFVLRAQDSIWPTEAMKMGRAILASHRDLLFQLAEFLSTQLPIRTHASDSREDR